MQETMQYFTIICILFAIFYIFFSREASMKSEKREKKNENRKMKTPVYDGFQTKNTIFNQEGVVYDRDDACF